MDNLQHPFNEHDEFVCPEPAADLCDRVIERVHVARQRAIVIRLISFGGLILGSVSLVFVAVSIVGPTGETAPATKSVNETGIAARAGTFEQGALTASSGTSLLSGESSDTSQITHENQSIFLVKETK
jgi:hypothetical protein